MMEKKVSTKQEQALDWLRSEIEKDKIDLENNKKKLIESIKSQSITEIVKPKEKQTIWMRIKKVLL